MKTTLAALVLMAATAALLHAMGQPWVCSCGTVKLWYNLPNSTETSQHLLDWYSWSHLMHGVVFWLGLSALRGPAQVKTGWSVPTGALLLLAVGLEAGWELLENSPMVIQRYRQTALNLGYTGDSILNSMSDITCMSVGFLLASRLSLRANLALFAAVEIFCAAMIRDNLTLNVIMLVHPVHAINAWQAALPH